MLGSCWELLTDSASLVSPNHYAVNLRDLRARKASSNARSAEFKASNAAAMRPARSLLANLTAASAVLVRAALVALSAWPML